MELANYDVTVHVFILHDSDLSSRSKDLTALNFYVLAYLK